MLRRRPAAAASEAVAAARSLALAHLQALALEVGQKPKRRGRQLTRKPSLLDTLLDMAMMMLVYVGQCWSMLRSMLVYLFLPKAAPVGDQ